MKVRVTTRVRSRRIMAMTLSRFLFRWSGRGSLRVVRIFWVAAICFLVTSFLFRSIASTSIIWVFLWTSASVFGNFWSLSVR